MIRLHPCHSLGDSSYYSNAIRAVIDFSSTLMARRPSDVALGCQEPPLAHAAVCDDFARWISQQVVGSVRNRRIRSSEALANKYRADHQS
jgi:hypothetical protein